MKTLAFTPALLWPPAGIAGLVMWAVIIAALIAIAVIAIRAMGLQIPQWAVNIFWVVVIALVAILAIRVILSL